MFHPETEIRDRQEADIARVSGGGFSIKLASHNIAERICYDGRKGGQQLQDHLRLWDLVGLWV